jgi:pimeloyl-ACP methyl ester carboxylesterase
MGLSSFQPGRRLLDWPADVVAVADHLHLDRFAVLGVSGGGPYALVCASQLADRVSACAVVCGVGPLEGGTAGMPPSYRVALVLAQWFPWLLTVLLWAFSWLYRDEERAREALVKGARPLGEADRAALLIPEVSAAVAASLVEAFRQGTRGVAYEARIYARPWGFRLEEMACPRLLLWHGERDPLVPITMARSVAARLRQCQATFSAQDGHFSILVNHLDDIITALIS